jgi:hypothetical protein
MKTNLLKYFLLSNNYLLKMHLPGRWVREETLCVAYMAITEMRFVLYQRESNGSLTPYHTRVFSRDLGEETLKPYFYIEYLPEWYECLDKLPNGDLAT